MLDKINEQKKLRRRALNTECKKKMLKNWKDLPNIARYSEDFTEECIPSVDLDQTQKEREPIKVKDIPNFKELQK